MLLTLLVACGGYNTQEAHMVFDRANNAGFDAYVSTYRARNSAGDRDEANFTWTNDGDSWEFEGTVTGDGTYDWTGTIDVYGRAWWTDSTFDGEWGVEYFDVAEEGIVLDGAMDWTIALEGDHDSGSLNFTALGDIAATGDAEGTGEIDYEANVEVDANSFSFSAEGTVDGTPIDESFTLVVLD